MEKGRGKRTDTLQTDEVFTREEYIEREAVFDALFGQYCASCDETEQALNAAIEEIKAIPAADVVPVVRCGECAYHDTADYGDGYTKNVCRLLNRQIQDDDYCSYAWRKGGDGDA